MEIFFSCFCLCFTALTFMQTCLTPVQTLMLVQQQSLHILCICRSRSLGGLGRIWPSSCSQNRLQEPRGRHRLSTVIQPLRQNAGEVVDLTVDEDGKYESSWVKIATVSHVMLCNKTELCPCFVNIPFGLLGVPIASDF